MQPHSNITRGTAICMLVFAVGIDGIEILLDMIIIGFILNWFLDLCATFLFSIWFSHKGESLWKKRPGGMLTTIVVDLVPGGDFVLPWTWLIAWSLFKSGALSSAIGV